MFSTKYPIILASNSPRRQQILEETGIEFTVLAKHVNEDYPDTLAAKDVPAYIARQKALAVHPFVKDTPSIIIAADTIVKLGEKIFEKPKDGEDAFQTLSTLSNQTHEVLTGVCILSNEQEHTFTSSTKVYFNPLTDKEINHYIQAYQPYDKAGSYAIQEWIGMIGIRKIEGCYFNVMGLPISKLYTMLQKHYI